VHLQVDFHHARLTDLVIPIKCTNDQTTRAAGLL